MFLLFHGRYGLPIDIFDQDSILADSCKHVLFTWSPYRMNALFGGTVQKSREKELEAQEVRAFQSLVKMLSMCHLRSKGPNLIFFEKTMNFWIIQISLMSGFQRKKVDHGLLLWLMPRSSCMQESEFTQHSFCFQWCESQPERTERDWFEPLMFPNMQLSTMASSSRGACGDMIWFIKHGKIVLEDVWYDLIVLDRAEECWMI